MESTGLYSRFVACMAAFLNGESVPFDTASWPIDEWKALYALSRRQSLSGALCTSLGTAPMPEAAKMRLQRDAFQMMASYETQREIVADIARAFGEAGIDHLFFKGAVVREYYRHPAMRSMGDVDLVIRPADTAKAHAAMLSLGFVCDEEGGEVWTYTRRDYVVEMHTAVRRYDVYRQDTVWYDDPFRDAVLQSGTTYRWCDEQEAAHTVMHLAAHFCAGGCGIRQWMDVAVLCQTFPQASFWQAVGDRLEPFGMRLFMEHALYVCRVWFGVEVPASAKPMTADTVDQLLCRVLQDGTFGADERLMLADVRKALRRERKSGKWVRRWRWVFPEAAYVRARFPYAARHGVLLPVAYVHRLALGLTKNRNAHLRRMQYAHDRQDSLQQESAFFEEIGL